MGAAMKYAEMWQTPLAIAATLIVLLPILIAAFVAAACLDFLQRLTGTWEGDGFSFYLVGIQWGFAAAGAVFCPHLLFRRANPYVVAWALIGLVAAVLLFLAVGTFINGDPASFNQWLTVVSIPVGTGIGALSGAQAVRRRTPKSADALAQSSRVLP